MLRHVLKAVEAAPGLSLRRMWTISRWRRCLLSAAGYCSSIYSSIVVVVVWGAIFWGSRPPHARVSPLPRKKEKRFATPRAPVAIKTTPKLEPVIGSWF